MLIQQRQPFKKGWPGMWDITVGGSAVSGDDSRSAAHRELLEELGLSLSFETLRPMLTVNFEGGFDDVYLLRRDVDIDTLVLTHKHGDHAGGRARILALAPHIEVVTGVTDICKDISTYPMAGHTTDCIGVLDMRTRTLLSGDGLQGAGVDKYRCSLTDRAAYLETVERVKNDIRVENILFSHAYEPWYTDRAVGRETVLKSLADCVECVK